MKGGHGITRKDSGEEEEKRIRKLLPLFKGRDRNMKREHEGAKERSKRESTCPGDNVLPAWKGSTGYGVTQSLAQSSRTRIMALLRPQIRNARAMEKLHPETIQLGMHPPKARGVSRVR